MMMFKSVKWIYQKMFFLNFNRNLMPSKHNSDVTTTKVSC